MKNSFSSSALVVSLAIALSPEALLAKTKHHPEAKAVPASKPAPFNVVEATIPEMQAAMQQGRIT